MSYKQASLFGFMSDSENEEETVPPSRNISEKAALPNPAAPVIAAKEKNHRELPQETKQELVQPQKKQKPPRQTPEQASLFGFISDSDNEEANGELEGGQLVEPEEIVPPPEKAKEPPQKVKPEKLTQGPKLQKLCEPVQNKKIQAMPEKLQKQSFESHQTKKKPAVSEMRQKLVELQLERTSRKQTPEQAHLFGFLSDSDNEEANGELEEGQLVEPEEIVPPPEKAKEPPQKVKPEKLTQGPKLQKLCEPVQNKKMQAMSEKLQKQSFESHQTKKKPAVSEMRQKLVELQLERTSRKQTPEQAHLFGFLSDSDNEEENVTSNKELSLPPKKEKAELEEGELEEGELEEGELVEPEEIVPPQGKAKELPQKMKPEKLTQGPKLQKLWEPVENRKMQAMPKMKPELKQPQQQQSRRPTSEQGHLFGFLSDSDSEEKNVACSTQLPKKTVPPIPTESKTQKKVYEQQQKSQGPTSKQDNPLWFLSDSDNEEKNVPSKSERSKKATRSILIAPLSMPGKKNPKELPQKPKLQKKVNEQQQDQKLQKTHMEVSRDRMLPRNSMMPNQYRKMQMQSFPPRQDRKGQNNSVKQAQDQKLKPTPLMHLKLQPPPQKQHLLPQQIESRELPREPKLQEIRCVSPLDKAPSDRKFTFLPRLPKKKFEPPQDQKLNTNHIDLPRDTSLQEIRCVSPLDKAPTDRKFTFLPRLPRKKLEQPQAQKLNTNQMDLPRDSNPQKRASDEPLGHMHKKRCVELTAQLENQQKKGCEQPQEQKLNTNQMDLPRDSKPQKRASDEPLGHMHKKSCVELTAQLENQQKKGCEQPVTAQWTKTTEQDTPVEPAKKLIPKLKLRFKYSDLIGHEVCLPVKPSLKIRIKNPFYQEFTNAEKTEGPIDVTTLYEEKEGDKKKEEEHLLEAKKASIAESSTSSSTMGTTSEKKNGCSVPNCKGWVMIGCKRCDEWYHWCIGQNSEPISGKRYCEKCVRKIQKRKEKKRAMRDAEDNTVSAKKPKH